MQAFVACVQDLRYAGKWLPLDPSENSINSYASVETVGVDNGCPSSACGRPTVCPAEQYCYDEWRQFTCR